MGRWFGYRDGYADVCRLWLTDEARGWYEHVTEATGELKRDFARMKRRQATPREFGLRVRTHPDTLLITARNKMATGVTVEIERDISLIGRGVESSRLFAGRNRNEANAATLGRFFAQLGASGIEAERSPHGGALIWPEVPAEDVADLLTQFLTHPLKLEFQGEAIAEFIRNRSAERDGLLLRWTVALPTEGRDTRPVTEIPALRGYAVKPGYRKIKLNAEDRSLQISGKGAKVGGRKDLRHGFSTTEYSRVKDAANEGELRAKMSSPLLLVFMLRGFEQVGTGSQAQKID
jgi:hypothetical protein